MSILLFAFTLLLVFVFVYSYSFLYAYVYRGRAPTRRSPSQQGARSLGGADDEGENSEGGEAETPLGCVPHQLRGFLHSFRMHTLVAPAYSACTACSHAVRDVHYWMPLHLPVLSLPYVRVHVFSTVLYE